MDDHKHTHRPHVAVLAEVESKEQTNMKAKRYMVWRHWDHDPRDGRGWQKDREYRGVANGVEFWGDTPTAKRHTRAEAEALLAATTGLHMCRREHPAIRARLAS